MSWYDAVKYLMDKKTKKGYTFIDLNKYNPGALIPVEDVERTILYRGKKKMKLRDWKVWLEVGMRVRVSKVPFYGEVGTVSEIALSFFRIESEPYGVDEIYRFDEDGMIEILPPKTEQSMFDVKSFEVSYKKKDKEDKVEDTIINAKVLLELNACEDGFKWFVNLYGKNDVPLLKLDSYLQALNQTSYRQWLHEKFPQLKKKERTFKVGDKFVLKDTKSVYILSKWQGLRQVTLFREDGTDFMDTYLVSVNNTNHITEDELNNIHKNFFVYFDPI